MKRRAIRPFLMTALAPIASLLLLAAGTWAAEPIRVVGRANPVNGWIMNDLAAAQAEARKTGKPIFVVFRCEA